MVNPTHKAYRSGSREAKQPFFPFSRKSVYNPSLVVAFTHGISVQRGQARRPASDTFAESPPRRACQPAPLLSRERRKQHKFGVQEKWGLGSVEGGV